MPDTSGTFKRKIMNPFFLILLVGGAVAAYSLLKTAKAARNLNYSISGFAIYQVQPLKNNLTFRVTAKFSNPESQPLFINYVDLTAYVDSTYTTTTENGETKYNVTSNGTKIATLTETTNIEIKANSITTYNFYPKVQFTDLAIWGGSKLLDRLRGQSGQVKPKNVLIKGSVKAEGITFPIEVVVPFN